MQVHFDGTRKASDRPGFDITLSPAATPFSAGVLSSAASFVIPPVEDSFQVGSHSQSGRNCRNAVPTGHAVAGKWWRS